LSNIQNNHSKQSFTLIFPSILIQLENEFQYSEETIPS